MPQVEFNCITGHASLVYDSLSRSISNYKRGYNYIKIGITGRNPQQRFDENSKIDSWQRMVVLYETTSISYANNLEYLLIERHKADLVNQKAGGGSYLAEKGYNYLYVLLGN